MMTNDDERGEGGGKKCQKFDDVICERPLRGSSFFGLPPVFDLPTLGIKYLYRKNQSSNIIFWSKLMVPNWLRTLR